MKNCPQCKSVYPEDYIFCLIDGNSLIDTDDEQETRVNQKVGMQMPTEFLPFATDVVCSSCGLTNRANSRFCKKCGTPVSAAPPAAQNSFGNPHQAFSGFEVQLNSDSQNSGNPERSLSETVAFQMPDFTPPKYEIPPEKANRNMIYALLAVGGIALSIVGFALFQADGNSATANKNSASNSGNKSDKMTASNAAGNAFNLPNLFERDYIGTIAGNPFSMSLKRDGSDLRGTASTHRVDQVYGTIESDGRFELKGYENDDVWTGNYKGQIYSDGSITGTWTTLQDTKPTSFSLTEQN